MTSDPLVSIVLSSYNQPEYLKIAFESLISQTYKNIEIIIADDCSENPLNRKLILEYADKYPSQVKYIFQPYNKGIAKNKNSGYRLARGRFITLLDGDDFYFPEKIEYEIALFTQQPHLDVVYSNFVYVDSSGEFKNSWAAEKLPEGKIFEKIVREDFPHSMLYNYELIKKEVFDKNGYLDENLKMYEDWDFRIRYSSNSLVGYTGKVLSVYRRTSNSISKRTSLSCVLKSRAWVIEKNKDIIATNFGLKNFYLSFKQKNTLNHLFDTDLGLNTYFFLCMKTFFLYPFKLVAILKSVKYYFLNRADSKS